MNCRHTLGRASLGALLTLAWLPLLGPLVAPARAAESGPVIPLRAGQWALRFGVAFAEDPWATLSAKRHFSDRSALQLEVATSVRVGKETSAQVVRDIDTTVRIVRATEDTQDYTLRAAYLFYPRPGRRASVYLSTGPFVAFGRTHRDGTDEIRFPGGIGIQAYRRSTWGVGALTKVGFEWSFARRLSLGTEYGIALQYRHSRETLSQRSWDRGVPFDYERTVVAKTFYLNTTQLGLGVTYYF